MLHLQRAIGLSFFVLSVSMLRSSTALAQEIGFSERFALAENREMALAELIPGTETYFYYQCLHCQTEGKISEARGYLDSWIAKLGSNEQNQRMRTRQFILEYKTNPQATIRYLKSEFGIQTEHPAPRKDEAAELPTQLDSNLLKWETLFNSHASNLGNVETIALGHAFPLLKEQTNLRGWLERIDRPDVPGLIDAIERELKMQDSRGFGWAPIHNQLTSLQLIELQTRLPSLLESNAFIQARLRRIRPTDDQSLDSPAVLREHLVALEEFVKGLPESQNSLKASVLFHRLELDERNGDFDRERFLRYIALPSNRPFSNRDYVAKQSRRPQVDLGSDYQSVALLQAVGQDNALVLRYLEHFFQRDANVDRFSPYIDRDYLRRVFATTKILYGIGDAKTHYAQLSPDEQRELQARVEVHFANVNPKYFEPSDSVRIALDLKNVPEMLVKVYRLNARNILTQQKRPVGTAIDLDGLVANVEKRFTYALPAERRHRELLDLPELDGGGIWVVDVVAGGLRSRTLVNKGHLHAIHRASNAGDVFRVFDAQGKHVPTAKALFGTREFAAEKDGDIVIPFGEETRQDYLILFDGPIASVQQFAHSVESYQLQAGFLLDPQSLLAGSQASLVIRPNLLCNGELVSIGQLEKPTLTITSTDLDGISTTQTYSDIQLADSRELVKTFLVPRRLASIATTLRGEVLLMSRDTRVSVSANHSVSINESARTSQIRDFYLTQSDKGFALEVRGRNGEPAGRTPVHMEFKMHGLVPTTSARLATNELGILDLGPLADVEHFKATADAIGTREFSLTRMASPWPTHYHARRGEPIELAMSTPAGPEPIVLSARASAKAPGRYSLMEYRSGMVVASHPELVSVDSGLLKIQGLEPGTYRLTDHGFGRSTQIAVVHGDVHGNLIVGQQKILETNRVRPVSIQQVLIDSDKVNVTVGNHDTFVRIHVIANAFRPFVNFGLSLPSPALPLTSSSRARIPSFYINSMKLDEEYQYVLQRQFAKKFLGSLLPQPSALLNPWELAVTQNASKQAQAGDPMAALAPPSPAASKFNRSEGEAGNLKTTALPDYEFLKRGTLLIANGQCDENGLLSLDRKTLKGLTSVTLLLVHPSSTSYRELVLPLEQPREYTDRRLAKAFNADDKLTEIQSVQLLNGIDKSDLGDASSTRVKLYSSIPEVFQLYRTLLSNHPSFEKFECLNSWSTLQEKQKEVFYAELACHEMNLFLKLHDKPFFERVVRPLVANKLQKQFMDDYVLESELTNYMRPWKLAQLNAVEQVLLAKKVAEQTGRTRRWMSDLVESKPADSAELSRRFATALMRTALGDSGLWDLRQNNNVALAEDFEMRDGLRRKEEVSLQLGGIEAMPKGSDENRPRSDQFFKQKALGEAQSEGKEIDGKQASDKSGMPALGRSFSGDKRLSLERGRARLFESLESTRKWSESNYFRLPIQNQNADVVRPNRFWLDYLNHSGDTPFLSKHLDLPASNIHESLMALAVLGLPLQSDPVEVGLENGRLIASNVKSSIAFVQGLQSVEPSKEPVTLLASQNIYLADEPNETAKPVQDKSLIKGTVYRLRVVLTNPGAVLVKANVLQQIPQGAIALENAKVVAGHAIDLAPFATQELTTKFYFPVAGAFAHFGSQITIDGRLAIAAPSTQLKVLDSPDTVDETSWSYVAAWGSNDQVLAYLKQANLFKIDLDAIVWRLSDVQFFTTCLDQLSQYGIYHDSLWAYALKHNHAKRMQEYLEKTNAILQRVGVSFRADIMEVEPVDRLAYEHLDFRPLIVARTHQLGPKRVILNDGLAVQYERLMGILSHQSSIGADQRIALVYYMLLQNRIEEAIAHFAKIDAAVLESKLQYESFAVYLDMLQGKFDESNARSQKYVDHPSPRWRDWFAQVRSQVAERKALQAGVTTDPSLREDWKTDSTSRILSGAREQRNASDSEKLPALDLVQEGERIVMRYRNLAEVEINYYLMDVELLFSRNPFAQQDGGRLNTIEPNFTENRKLSEAKSTLDTSISIPEKLKNKNVAIEVIGGGLTRNLVVYSNSLVVQVSSNMGRIQVLTKQGLQPLDGAYVKVYSRSPSGESKFYKDGYTDLRGQFDFASLSTQDLDSVQRFALLVLHPEHGTIVRETDPPKR